METKTNPETHSVCPTCGRCPTCGQHARPTWPVWPTWPTYPTYPTYPWWQGVDPQYPWTLTTTSSSTVKLPTMAAYAIPDGI